MVTLHSFTTSPRFPEEITAEEKTAALLDWYKTIQTVTADELHAIIEDFRSIRVEQDKRSALEKLRALHDASAQLFQELQPLLSEDLKPQLLSTIDETRMHYQEVLSPTTAGFVDIAVSRCKGHLARTLENINAVFFVLDHTKISEASSAEPSTENPQTSK